MKKGIVVFIVVVLMFFLMFVLFNSRKRIPVITEESQVILPTETDFEELEKQLSKMNHFSPENEALYSIYENQQEQVSIWGYQENETSEKYPGYGIIIEMQGEKYIFPDVHHGMRAGAGISEDQNYIYLAGTDVSGTSILRTHLYVFQIGREEVSLVYEVTPEQLECMIAEEMESCITRTNKIHFYWNNKNIFSKQLMADEKIEGICWGSSQQYLFDKEIITQVTPGIRCEGRSTWIYDEMPLVSFQLNILKNDEGNITGSELECLGVD